MKTRYKVVLIAVCAYFGVFLVPVIASNVYCDFISQEICTSRITGVILLPFNMILPSLPSDDCLVNNNGILEPCYGEPGLVEWPFSPRMEDHPERNCDVECTDGGKMPPCTSGRTACFDNHANLCDPSGWDCSYYEEFFEEIMENEN